VIAVHVFLASVFTLAAVAGAPDSSQAAYTLRVGIGHNPRSSWVKAMMRFQEEVEVQSGGQIKVNVYHSGQLGSTQQTLEMVYLDAIEIAVPGAAQVEAYVPEAGVIVLPYIWKTEQQMFAALDCRPGEIIEAQFGKMNFHSLGWFANGFRCVTNSRKPIESIEDMKGLKVRVIPSPAVMEYFKAVGAAPVHIDWVELYEALKMGVVDAQENPPFFVYLGRMHEVQKYYSLTRHMNEPGVIIMNRKFYDKLEPRLQEILDTAGRNAARWQHTEMQKDNDEMLEQLKASGSIEINELSETAIESFQKIAREKAYPVIIEKQLCGPQTRELIEMILSDTSMSQER